MQQHRTSDWLDERLACSRLEQPKRDHDNAFIDEGSGGRVHQGASANDVVMIRKNIQKKCLENVLEANHVILLQVTPNVIKQIG